MTTIHEQKPDDLAKRVLGRIDLERLAPRPRWEFLLKNYVLWGLGALAVVFGALAFSATLFEIQSADWQLSPATHPDSFSFFIETAPFFWIIALALFTLLGYLYVRRTQHGYRYPLMAIMFGAVALSLVCGTGLFAAGYGGTVEESLGDHPGLYRPILAQERSWWAAPEKGLLGGDVATVTPAVASPVVLHDLFGRTWSVDTSDLRGPGLATLARGGRVRIVGAPATTSGAFHACFVFPWGSKGVRPRLASTSPQRVGPVLSAKGEEEKSDLCRNIRPYKQLRDVETSETTEQ
jgi:hypothetical protein